KLYNSCQRYYNRILYDETEENYHNFIRSINNYIHGWNNNTIVRYLEFQRIENTPVAVMSLMQHYGFPTPLLDFSEDPFVALYFSSLNDSYDSNTKDIRNYSSLYLLDTKIKELEEFNKEYQINSVMGYSDQFFPLLSTKLLVISKNTPEFKL